MIFLAKGTFKIGRRTVGAEGNVVKEIPAKFEASQDGGSVAVGILDDETEEQIGQADLFGDYDHWGILNRVLQLLAPTRPGNMPEFENIFVKMYREQATTDCPFRPYCDRVRCSECACWDWIENAEEG